MVCQSVEESRRHLSIAEHQRPFAEGKVRGEQSAVARGGIGSLLLAARRGYDWVYVGAVGTGFKDKDAAYLKKTLDKLKTRTPVVPLKGRDYVFAQPTLIAEIEFRGWTDDGNLRHASYKSLWEIQDNAAVHALD
jgi:bifunctional non-homologous end joining protein LigD